MLLCAEDLGMIPSTVPEVLHQLQILSLELERMPKDFTPHGWASPQLFPYHSIATTSTHDMPSLRGWWHSLPEDKRQAYLIEELGRSREEVPALLAQETLVYRLILQHYLTSPTGCPSRATLPSKVPKRSKSITPSRQTITGLTASPSVQRLY